MNNGITKIMLVATLASATAIAGCAGSTMSNSETTAVIGTIVGAAAGREFGKGNGRKLATLVGAGLGGYLGANLGRTLDSYDQNNINTSLSNTPDNRPVNWNNQNTGANYTFIPTNTYQGQVNQQPARCRDYTMRVMMDGAPQNVQGRACLVNGQWVNAS